MKQNEGFNATKKRLLIVLFETSIWMMIKLFNAVFMTIYLFCNSYVCLDI
ncbi:hypothetical protein SAMN04487910_2703 [Aquimarina amphilecti]|uniref:Uncharacterized protein n=1 Tax=Aquimarina amphilecti TaxID=1038014 RepID=A0A1H7QW28_AQUAM|nr:hypothetical protein SAMN04487910_2703 [Aquimarina amphilecti]